MAHKMFFCWKTPSHQIGALCVMALAIAFRADAAFGKPEIQLTVEQVSEKILPYQAAVLRISAKNIGDVPYGPLLRQFSYQPLTLRKAGQAESRKLRIVQQLNDMNRLLAHPNRADGEPAVTIEPGQTVSTSFAIAAEWDGQTQQEEGDRLPPGRNLGQPLFPAAGKYELQVEVILVAKEPARVAMATLTVSEPKDDDAKVVQLLARDVELASALMSAVHVANPAIAKRADDLISRSKGSSYVPYAQFAVARSRLQGIGWKTRPEIGGQETREDRLKDTKELFQAIKGSDVERAGQLVWILFAESISPEGWTDLVQNVIAEQKNADADDREIALNKLVDRLHLSEENIKSALTELTAIQAAGFAYAPNVACAIVEAARSVEPALGQKIAKEMVEKYPDDAAVLKNWEEDPKRERLKKKDGLFG